MSSESILNRRFAAAGAQRRPSVSSRQHELFDILFAGYQRAPSLLVFTENVNATYFISFDLPLRPMVEAGELNLGVVSQGRVKAILEEDRSTDALDRVLQAWYDSLRPDVVVMTRYGQPHGARIMAWFQRARVRVIYHLDDDLLDVPESLGAEIVQRQGNAGVVDERRRLIACADKVYVSTLVLYETIRAKVPEQRNLVHGDIYAPFLGDRLAKGKPMQRMPAEGPVIGYMGSKGHQHDLELAVPALVRLMEENASLRFEVFGTIQMPEALKRFEGRIASHSVQASYVEFLGTLKTLEWTIGLAPLVDAAFNSNKAPTKFIEYTAAGIPVVASDTVVYQKAILPGTGVRVRNDQWLETLRELVNDEDHRQAMVAQAQAHCRATFSLDGLREQVLKILDLQHEQARQRVLRLFQGRMLIGRMKLRLMQGLKFGRKVVRTVSYRLLGRWTPHMPPGNPAAPQRVLFVANNFIPTLQLSFIKPLEPLIKSGEMAVDVVSETQMAEAFGGWRWKSRARKWMRRRFEAFRPTLVVFCRYSGPHGDALRDIARAQGVPVIYHIDDDLLNVPRELGAAKFAMHNDPRRLASVSGLLRDVDLVYCSTEPLRQRMAKHIGGRALAGKVYCTTDALVPPPKPRTEVRVGYMGFDHAHDFEIVVPALVKLLKTYPNVRFELFGSIPKPAALDEFGNRVVTHAPVPGYQKFMAKFASLGWNIGICPLADTPFNAVKANTKWVEYTSVGAAVVATGGTIYDGCVADGCGVLVQRPQDWYAALAELVESAEKRNALVYAAQARARQDYSLDSLRQQVLDVFAQARGVAQG